MSVNSEPKYTLGTIVDGADAVLCSLILNKEGLAGLVKKEEHQVVIVNSLNEAKQYLLESLAHLETILDEVVVVV